MNPCGKQLLISKPRNFHYRTSGINASMSNLGRSELNLSGNVLKNFMTFEIFLNNYCVEADYWDLAKDPKTASADHYKKPQLEIAVLRLVMPEEALQVI